MSEGNGRWKAQPGVVVTIIIAVVAYAVQFGVLSAGMVPVKEDIRDIKIMLRESYIPRAEAEIILQGLQQQIDRLAKEIEKNR